MAKTARWIYLKDMHGSSTIMNLDDGQKIPVYPAQIKDAAPIGLRRFILEQTGSSAFRETGEQQELTEDLYDTLVENHANLNSWNYDWVNYQYEASITPDLIKALEEKLQDMMAKHPFETKIWVQPRMLLYYSDGNYKSQQKFLTVCPHPGTLPYTATGDFKNKYLTDWNQDKAKAGVPFPKEVGAQGGGSPLLYRGPAAVVRFTLDGQSPAFEGCRVYVEPDGKFICSDWCQRHDFSSYSDGINLQQGIYDFDSWIVNACLPRAMSHGSFKPKNAKIEREQVRDMMKREGRPVRIPTFDEAMLEAGKKIKIEVKQLTVDDAFANTVSYSFDKLPEASVGERVDYLTSTFKEAYENGDTKALIGAPVEVERSQFYQGTTDLAKYKVGPELYGFRISDGNCGAEMTAGRICLKTPDGFHNHLTLDQVKLRIPELQLLLGTAIKAKLDQIASNQPAVEAGPITADSLAEAKKLVYGYDDKELEAEREELFKLNIEKASKMTVEVADHYVVPIVPVVPQVVTYDHAFGQVELHAVENADCALVNWTSGPYATNEARYIRYSSEQTVEALSPGESYVGKNPKWEPVDPLSAIGTVGIWYYEHFLPTQLKAQHKAEATAVDFEVGSDSFRAYPVIDGATIKKVVNGAVTESVTIRKKSNGHIYRVEDDGNTVLFADGDLTLKEAAAYYLKYLLSGHEKSLKLNSIAKDLVTK